MRVAALWLRENDMKGDTAIIRLLNQVLTNELTAVNQYFLHARMCMYENLGPEAKLGQGHLRRRSIGEMKHADKLTSSASYSSKASPISRTCTS